MKLVDLKINEYLDVLKSDAPAPGGGSVSAFAGAQAIGLALMVAELTIGKEKYAKDQEYCQTVQKKGTALHQKLVRAIDEDTNAFNLVSKAFQMPKGTEEEKEIRKKAIAEGTLEATEVPYRVMQYAYEGLCLIEGMVGKSNPNAASDLGVSALNLAASVKGAWLNVMINLPGVKDKEKARAFAEEGKEICDKAEVLADQIYKAVEGSL